MELHWRDINNLEEKWSYLELSVNGDHKPTLSILSGDKQRFKIQSTASPVCWGAIEDGFHGAWFLRNDNDWTLEQMPVRPIKSSDIEESISQSKYDLNHFWARFFAKELSLSKCSPLYPGKWIITNQRQYIETTNYLPEGHATDENKVGFYQTRPLYLNWGSAGNYCVMALKSMPSETDGRVKWWRKKVKQATCPPALIWFVTCLEAYVVLHGHARLRAFQLEGKKPEYMVLKPLNELNRERNPFAAEQIHKSLEERRSNPRKPPLPLHKVNDLLIQVYDDRPFITYRSKGLAKANFGAEWLNEVQAFANRPGTDQRELEDMLYDPWSSENQEHS